MNGTVKQRRGAVEWAGSCYGIDLQGGQPVVVRAERSHGRVNWSPVPPNDPAFMEGIRSGKSMNAGSLSTGESFTCWLEAPFASSHKALKVLPALLDVQLPFALEECIYDFVEVGRGHAPAGHKGPQGRHGVEAEPAATCALAVAARVIDVQKKIDAFKALGIDPVVLDHEGLALWTRSVEEVPVRPGTEQALRVVVFLGTGRSTVAIGRGGRFLGSHSISHVSSAQIARFLKAYSGLGTGGTADTYWLWAGPGAADAGLPASLQEELRKEWPGPSFVHDVPGTFLARAIAIRAMSAGALRCNLRSGSLTHPAVARRTGRNAIGTALVYLAAGLLLCAMNLAWGVLVSQKEANVDRVLGTLADRLAGYHVTGKGEIALKMVKEAVKPRKEMLRPFLNGFEPSLADTIVSLVDVARKNDLNYEMLSIARDKATVNGTAGNWKKCEAVTDCLKQKGYSAGKPDRKESLVDSRVMFSVTTGGAGE